MFRKSSSVAVPVLMALFIVSISGFKTACGGHSGHGGGAKASSKHSSHPHSSAAHKQQQAKHTNKNHNQHNKGLQRPHGHYWGDGDRGDGEVDGGAFDSPAVDAAAVLAPVVILNPAQTRRTVNYTLGAAQYSIEPDHSLEHNDGTQVLTFDRGGSFGQASYTLQPGTYRFIATSTGWDLRTVTDPLVAGNPAGDE